MEGRTCILCPTVKRLRMLYGPRTEYAWYKRYVLLVLAAPLGLLMAAGVWRSFEQGAWIIVLLLPALAVCLFVVVVSLVGCRCCVESVYGQGPF